MMNIWSCKIGEVALIQDGADSPMREAVRQAYYALTGQEPTFIFSGWAAELTDIERSVADDKVQPPEHPYPACECGREGIYCTPVSRMDDCPNLGEAKIG